MTGFKRTMLLVFMIFSMSTICCAAESVLSPTPTATAVCKSMIYKVAVAAKTPVPVPTAMVALSVGNGYSVYSSDNKYDLMYMGLDIPDGSYVYVGFCVPEDQVENFKSVVDSRFTLVKDGSDKTAGNSGD